MSSFVHTFGSAAGGIVIDSPHSGQHYPADFAFSCSLQSLRYAEDILVDQLVLPLATEGAAVLCAEFPRSYIDVNRAVDDIDPALCADRIASKPSAYSRMGVGLIHRDARPALPIYTRGLTAAEIGRRIDQCYRPYHETLAGLIDQAVFHHSEVLHLNIHSMPSVSAPRDQQGHAYDLVIGTRDGQSAGGDVADMVAAHCRAAGLRAGINQRFKGGYILQRYGRPDHGIHSLQLEFNRALYVNERTFQLTDGAARITDILAGIIQEWMARDDLLNMPLAAE